jgi:hypothetical protein
MAFLIPSETPTNSPLFLITFQVILQDKESFNILNNLMHRFILMGRNSLHPLVSLLTIPIIAPQLAVAQNARNSAIFARTAVITSAEDAFGGDQGILPLTVKLRNRLTKIGKARQEEFCLTTHGDMTRRQETNDGRPFIHGKEYQTSRTRNGTPPRSNQRSSI